MKKTEKRNDSSELMQKIEAQVMARCSDKVANRIMKEVREDLVLPILDLNKSARVTCKLLKRYGDDCIEVVVGPRDFTFTKTGIWQHSGTVMS
jgi:hypothetical protein